MASGADDGSKSAPRTCASCLKPATNRCSGCLGAPAYGDSIPENTSYCSAVCQKANWGQHKLDCKNLQARKTLGNAALFLQSIFYQIRLHASPLQFKSIRREGSTIYLDGFQALGKDAQRLLTPFPICLESGRESFEAVLMFSGCGEALLYLHSFAKEILADLYSKIEEVTVKLTERKLRIAPILPTGQHIGPAESFLHNLYRVTLKSGETWAVDITGAQYGYPDPLVPWHVFEQHHSCQIIRVGEFGYIRQQIYQSYEMCPVRQMVAQRMEKQEITKSLEEKIPVWVQEYAGKLNTILDGKFAVSKRATNKFLDQLEDHLKVSMAKIYAPEQIVRRNKEVDRRFSENVASPDSQRRLDRMTKLMKSTFGSLEDK